MQKERSMPSTRHWIRRSFDRNGSFTGGDYWDSPGSIDRIIYDDGPKYSLDDHLNWKRCSHTSTTRSQGVVASWAYKNYHRFYPSMYLGRTEISWVNSRLVPSIPIGSWNPDVMLGIKDQLDLNNHDSVLLYSGVIQAVPLLGSIGRFNSIMRRLVKKMGKGIRKKPFTTVLKSAISLDFINRFVISPTIDDARKFADATNYCLRVIQTMHERNNHLTALQSELFDGVTEQTTESVVPSGGSASLRYTKTHKVGVTSKAFVLVDANYDIQAVDPIKLWADRVGLSKPLDSAWDLVPFSFVIDYFTRAGDMIAGLGEEMSSQDGLRANIARIHGAWGTTLRQDTYTCEGIGLEWINRPPECIPDGPPSLGVQKVSASQFDRFPIDLGILMNTVQDPEHGLISVNLSKTRVRTLLELYAQFKLR